MSETTPDARTPLNLLPGPVAVHPDVHAAFVAPAVSHRGAAFMDEMAALRTRLARLVNARSATVLLGSGTLANDAVGAQLAARKDRGLVVTTGEFGDRLLDHARRWQLDFAVHERAWGAEPDYADLERALANDRGIGWLWSVHCETSTGVLADLERLKAVCARHRVDLCLDAISSLGTLALDLEGVHLASGASNKGLASYPGLALVFADRIVEPAERLPRYLDIGRYEAHAGVPYTHSSNLVRALGVALRRLEDAESAEAHFREKAERMAWLRAELERRGVRLVAPLERASPAVLSLALPAGRSSRALGEALEHEGILLNYRGPYLLERNLIQICLMGECSTDGLARLLDRLEALALRA